MKKFFLVLMSIVTLCAFSPVKKKVTIYMAGDSTMTIQDLFRPVKDSITGQVTDEPFPIRGWGQMLPNFFNSNIVIENFAKSGLSTLTFISSGWWQKIMEKVQPNDFVVIGFGHNDEFKTTYPRYTTPEEYEANLRRFVDDVRGKGAIPILCTPVARRRFENGKLVDTHGVYSDAVRKIAKDENVLFVDMQKKTDKLILEYGESESMKLYTYLEPGVCKIYPKGKNDDTHFSELGATLAAYAFVCGLRELKIGGLTKNLK